MSGPSLQLGVSAAGQESLAGLNAELVALRSNLAALKTGGKADLSSLSGASQQLTLLRKEIANGQAGLQTAFADLAETIKGGFSATAAATQAGGARTRSLAAAERQANQALYDQAIAQRAQFTATELAQIKAGGVQLVEADRQRIAALAAVQAQANRTLGEVRNPLPTLQLSTAGDAEVAAAWAQRQKQMADQASAAKAAAWRQAELAATAEIEQAQVQGFKAWAATEKRLAAERIAEAKTLAAATSNGIAAAYANAAIQNSGRVASALQRGDRGKTSSDYVASEIASAQRDADAIAAAKAAAWKQADSRFEAERQQMALQSARSIAGMAKQASAIEAAAAKEADAAMASAMKANDAFVRETEAKARRDVAAIQKAADEVAKAEAAYQASTARAQAAAQRQARAQLEQGIAAPAVQANFGPTAASAAQAAGSLEALTLAHQKAGLAAVEHTPKLKGLSQAMNDAHSAARGLASGFGAMFLTWGSIAPLLAGAAISNAFVQVVKQGAAVEQTLEVIKQLSSETEQSIGMLRSTLLDLASNGPQGPKEIADAMKALSLAGLNAAEVASSVKAALTLSIVGEMPAQKAAESLVAISTAYAYAAGDFNRVNDVIAKTAAVSMSSVEGMTQSFRVASTVAQQYGVRLEDTATQLGLLANLGIRNQQAGTAVTQFYTGLAANTKKGHDALTMIVGDVGRLRDEFGNMKPAAQILDMLNEGLKRFSANAQTSLVSAVYNNRAQRAAVSNLLASRTPAFDEATGQPKLKFAVDENGRVTSKIITQWDDMAKKVTESYGFAAIAMANLSLTAENQMKSVMAALQGAFVSAFKDIEPTVLVVSQQLRTAFNGESFRSTLSGIANSVANFIVTLVEHANVLKLAAEAWLIYKAAMIGSVVFSGITAGLTALGAAFTAVRAGTTIAAGGMVALRAAMGPIGFILTAITAAWALYEATSTKASTTAADVASLKNRQIIDALDKESEKLEARNKLLLEGVSAREADIRLTGLQAQADQLKSSQSAQTEASNRIISAEGEVATLKAEAANLKGGYATEGTRKAFAEGIAAAEGRVVQAKQQQVTVNRDLLRNQEQLTNAVGRQQSAAELSAKLSRPKTPNFFTGGTDPYEKPKDTEVARANAKLTALKTIYAAEEAEAKKYYDQVNKIEAIRHTSGQTSDIQYQIEQTAREGIYYSNRIARLQQFIVESESALATMKARPDKGRDQKAEAEEQKEQIRLRSLRSELQLAQQITLEEQKAREFKLEADTSKFITQQMAALVLANQEADVKQSILTLTVEQQQVENARLAAAGKYTDEINKQKVQLTAAQQYLTSLSTATPSAANDYSTSGNSGKIASAQVAVDQLQGSVTRLQESATTAGTFAAESLVNRMKPQWQSLLDGWANVQQRMTEMYDAMVTGVVTQGEVAFDRLVKTGKASATEVLDAIRDVLIKNMYQSTVAPAMAALGQKIAEATIGARPQATISSPIDVAATKTAVTLDTLTTTGIAPTTSAFGLLMQAANYLGTALENAAAKAGFSGGGGGLLSSLFGGDKQGTGPNSGADYQNGSDLGFSVLDALGGAYGAQRYAFASGSPFTNRTFAQPTRFAFAGGAALGEMGEAGPEAVMPLKRGPDGSLGVVNHGWGGQQQAPAVSVVIENHSGGQVRQRETQKGDGTRELRYIIDAAVDEVVGQIDNGGRAGQAIERRYGVNGAAGLARR